MAINWGNLLKNTGGIYKQPASTMGNALDKFRKKTPTSPVIKNGIDLNTTSPFTMPKTNNPDIKKVTPSKPTYNPTANTINKNDVSGTSQPDWSSITESLRGLQENIGAYKPHPTDTTTTQEPEESNADKYFKIFLDQMQRTDEEKDLSSQLSDLTTGRDLGVTGLEGQGRGIPLSLVRGQQEKLMKQAAIQTQPLQKQLELLQADRLSKSTMAKTASDYYKEDEPDATDYKTVSAGQSLIDPSTGEVIYQGAPKQDYSGLKSIQGGLYDVEKGSWIIQPQASSTTGLGSLPTSYKEWKLSGEAEGTGKTYAEYIKKGNGADYGAKITETSLRVIDDVFPMITSLTTGPIGKLTSGIPGTASYNFKAALETLKSNIAFGALTEMRAASKTGGALGQVSDREGQLLQSSLGALDIGQSPTQFKSQLQKIRDSIIRWSQAMEDTSNQPASDNLSDDEAYDLYNQTK